MKRPKALITGVLGFAGSYLAEELIAAGYEVVGNRYKRESTTNIRHIRNRVQLVSLDIERTEHCRKILELTKPDYVFHLAAMASVGHSFSNERATLRINVDGTLNMLEAASKLPALKKFVYISSSECYGTFTPKHKTLTEDQPLNPISPYGISKATAERLSLYYYRQHGLPVSVARAFNHTGPRQVDTFVVPAFARQVAMIEAGKQKPVMSVGNLTAKRDLSDVRDIARGYRLIAERGKPGDVYQLCCGRAVKIQTVLDTLVAMSSRKIRVKTDKSRLRKADIPVLRGSYRKAARELGFEVQYNLHTTLADTLQYWRNMIRK